MAVSSGMFCSPSVTVPARISGDMLLATQRQSTLRKMRSKKAVASGIYVNPTAPNDFWDNLTERLIGGKLDPSKIWGMPATPPPEWSGTEVQQARYIGYLDGVVYGAGRAGVTVGLGALILGGLAGFFACKKWGKK